VIGADPRPANADEGRRGIEHAAERIRIAAGRALGYSVEERRVYAEVLDAALAALDAIAELRATQPRDAAPPVLTSSWSAHLRAMDAGDLAAALDYASRKRRDPAA
jgi:hypothetical protein